MRQHFLCCISIFFLCFAGFYADIDLNNSDVELFYTRVGLKNNGYRKKTVEIIKGTPNGDDWISKGYFTNSINRTGFGYLELETKHAVDSAVQAYHAGSLEGYLTAELIHARWFNTLHVLCREEPDNCRLVYSFVRRNSKWVSRKIKKFATDPYWYQVKLFYLQVNGVLDGYNSNGKYTKLDWDDILAMNIMLELGDILMMAGGAAKSHKFDNDHCSALIKIMANNSDIYFGHNSWYDYMEMLRILKKYNLRYAQSQSDPSLIPGHEFSMSSYPAALISIDDYYLIASSGFEPNGEVWEAVRSTVANRLAFDGKSWHETFKKFNSGTYNNQWMVLDYNYFVPGKKPESYLLWVGEQLPRFYQYEDVTDVLVNQGYWASYNVPYFKEVFERSGYKEAVHVNGTWFSYTEAPRAKIFARDQGNVTDMESFMKLMRSNNFKHDPFAFCNCTPPYSASGAIAARRDLNPVDGQGEQVCKPYGAIDAKITNHSMFKRYAFTAVVGPTQGTNDELPVFKWSESAFAKEAPHMMQPDEFNFTPLTFEWKYVEGKRGLDENGVVGGSVDYNIWEEVFAGDDNNIPID